MRTRKLNRKPVWKSKRIEEIKSNVKLTPASPLLISLYHEEWNKFPTTTDTFETFFWKSQYFRNRGKLLKTSYQTTYLLKYLFQKPWIKYDPCKINWDALYKYIEPNSLERQ
jgi:hypothetical protein